MRQLACGEQKVFHWPSRGILLQSSIGVLIFSLLAGCAGTTQIPSPKPPPSTILWSDSMESGNLSHWDSPDPSGNPGGGVFVTGIAFSSASQDVAHSGSYSAKLTITTPNLPTSGVRLFRWLEPRTHVNLYYSVWYYFPQIYTPLLYWNVFQWKSQNPSANDPFFNLVVGNRSTGEMYLYLRNENTNSTWEQTALNIPVGRWFQVEAFQVCDGSGAGRVVVWQDGVQLWDIQNVSTRHVDGDCQWSVNNYSSGLTPSTATIYIDDAVISTARAGARPAPSNSLGAAHIRRRSTSGLIRRLDTRALRHESRVSGGPEIRGLSGGIARIDGWRRYRRAPTASHAELAHTEVADAPAALEKEFAPCREEFAASEAQDIDLHHGNRLVIN